MSYYDRVDETVSEITLKARLNDLEECVIRYEKQCKQGKWKKGSYYYAMLQTINEIKGELEDRELAEELFLGLPDQVTLNTGVSISYASHGEEVKQKEVYIISYYEKDVGKLLFSQPIQANGKSGALCKFYDSFCKSVVSPWKVIKRDYYKKRIGVMLRHEEGEETQFLPFAICVGRTQQENIDWEQWEYL